MRHNALFRRFISALTRGGPGGLPRPIEVHAHDPLRYVGDMLGWLHQVGLCISFSFSWDVNCDCQLSLSKLGTLFLLMDSISWLYDRPWLLKENLFFSCLILIQR